VLKAYSAEYPPNPKATKEPPVPPAANAPVPLVPNVPPAKEPKPVTSGKVETPGGAGAKSAEPDTPDAKVDAKVDAEDKGEKGEAKPEGVKKPGPDVVEPGGGMGCCGGAQKATPLAPPEAAPKEIKDKVAWEDPAKGSEDRDRDRGDRGDKDVSEEEEVVPKHSSGFDTPPVPRDRTSPSKGKLSFRPRSQPRERDRDESEDSEGDMHRAGLGRQDDEDAHVRNRFRRREEGPEPRGKNRREEEEDVQTRWGRE
jgi:hypothetical protein